MSLCLRSRDSGAGVARGRYGLPPLPGPRWPWTPFQAHERAEYEPMGWHAVRYDDEGQEVIPSTAADGSGRVAATRMRNFVLSDFRLDWLNLYGDDRGLIVSTAPCCVYVSLAAKLHITGNSNAKSSRSHSRAALGLRTAATVPARR